MAFAFTADSPNPTHRSGRFKVYRGSFTNADGDTGGTVDTGMAYIRRVSIDVTSHVGAPTPKITISAPNVTIETGEGVDGNFEAEGSGQA